METNGGVIVMKTIVQYFLILISLIVASYLMGTATAKDKSEVLYLTFDDDKPKDLSPNKTPIANFNKPRKVVKGVVGKAWLFDDNTAVLIDHQGFNDVFQESTFSVWLKEPDKDGILYEEGGGTNGYAVTLVGGKVEFATRDGGNQTTLYRRSAQKRAVQGCRNWWLRERDGYRSSQWRFRWRCCPQVHGHHGRISCYPKSTHRKRDSGHDQRFATC